jgi:hypothetical protein
LRRAPPGTVTLTTGDFSMLVELRTTMDVVELKSMLSF